tara:strand:- start:362 stop:1036 length:675 start_codon:yes stop_codon:yes gene_type:complete
MIKNIYNLGDAALYCDFGNEVNKNINSNVIKYFKTLQKKNFKEIINLAPSYNKLIISFDLGTTNFNKIKDKILKLNNLEEDVKDLKKIKVPVCYDDEFSLDMKRIEDQLHLSKDEIIKLSLNKNYFCYMTGFVAGMPFLGDIEKKLRLNRLETPRVKVPKGSVGITEQFCNVYTFESPGGWNIIGNTPLRIFNQKNETNPTLINPGDEVSFYQISKKEFLNWNE